MQVRPVALGGYKQPQQLMALNYLLTLGVRLDVVIELDGFNGVALPASENRSADVSHYYPRGWQWRAASVLEPVALKLIGELSFLQARRTELAVRCSQFVVRHSGLGNLVWRLLDRNHVARRRALEQELEAASRARLRFATHGPKTPYGSEAEFYPELARIWRVGSLQMFHLCRANGIRYFHFLQPNQYFPDSKPLSAEERRLAFVPGHGYQRPVELGYPALRAAGQTLRGLGVPFEDLSMIFAGVRETLYIDDCCHLNDSGNRLLADAIAARVAQRW